MKKTEKEFEQISAFIDRHWERAVGLANAESLMTYWAIGAFVSTKLKSAEWGSKVIEELCDYLKTHSPKRRGFSKRQIYNMVEFFEAYSSQDFKDVSERLRLEEFVQLPTAQIVHFQNAQMPSNGGFNRDVRCVNQVLRTSKEGPKRDEIVQLLTAQFDDIDVFVDDFPLFLSLTTFTNHIEILCRIRSIEERVFYVLYAAHERLNQMELRRSIAAQTYDMVMSKEKSMSRALRISYPKADFLLKDKAFLDFLNLPKKHTEPKLHKELVQHMKEFVLEIGKDFLYMGDEYQVHVGGETRRLDLLFYHRGLRCLVDVELKAVGFQPEFVSKLDMYLEAIDREIRREGENPAIGIILCPTADRCRVEYTLNRTMSPMMVAEYRRLLVPEEVMKKSLEEYCRFMKREV